MSGLRKTKTTEVLLRRKGGRGSGVSKIGAGLGYGTYYYQKRVSLEGLLKGKKNRKVSSFAARSV